MRVYAKLSELGARAGTELAARNASKGFWTSHKNERLLWCHPLHRRSSWMRSIRFIPCQRRGYAPAP